MNIDETLYGYAVDSVKRFDATVLSLFSFSAVVLYVLFIGAKSKNERLREIEDETVRLMKWKSQLKQLDNLRTYYESPLDPVTPTNYKLFAASFLRDYAEFQLINMLSFPRVQELQKTHPEFFYVEIHSIRNRLYLLGAKDRRLIDETRHVAELRFDDLGIKEIKMLSNHSVNDVLELYYRTGAAIEALQNASDTEELRVIYRKRFAALSLNAKPQNDTSISKETDEVLSKMQIENINSIKELEKEIASLKSNRDKIDEELDRVVTIPILDLPIRYSSLAWGVPFVVFALSVLMKNNLDHAQALIRGMDKSLGYISLMSRYPSYLYGNSSQELSLHYAIKQMLFILPVAAALVALRKGLRGMTKWRIVLACTFSVAAILIIVNIVIQSYNVWEVHS